MSQTIYTTAAGGAASNAKAKGDASPRTVAIAGLIGATIEWFDFFIYGTAAVVFHLPVHGGAVPDRLPGDLQHRRSQAVA